MKNLSASLPRTGEGIVIDLGTGDGRFVSQAARDDPNKFFIGVDANAKPLEKPSMKATRKPAKGGLPNAMFVQAAAEDLPEEFEGVANEIHIHFPWGSLLSAVATADPRVVSGLRRAAAADCILEVVIGIDPVRDRSEIKRLNIPDFTESYIRNSLVPAYERLGFRLIEHGTLGPAEWPRLTTSWVRKLSGNDTRVVRYFVFEAD